MSDPSLSQTALPPCLSSRSMGLKLIVVCGLALLMTIPAFLVQGLIDDRTAREDAVVKDISSHVGGQQTFLGPTLAIPYTIAPQSPGNYPKRGAYLIFPADASASVQTSTEERRRSLFKVPVFQASLKMDATFDLSASPSDLPAAAQLDWDKAEFVIGVSDPRGALSDALLTTDGTSATLVPAEVAQSINIGNNPAQNLKLRLFGVKAAGITQKQTALHVSAVLRFSGARHIAILAYGKTTRVSIQGDWPSPGFDGGFLPASRSVSDAGFHADWSVPFIARGVRAEGPSESILGLDAASLGISFVEVADPYQSVNRALKYVPLFLGLLFLTYFIFEVTTGKRVHPAQYILVGVAQIIFYLLLLSFAERVGFDFSFLISGAATVALLATNAGWIFRSRTQAARAFVVFTMLYGLIYMLLRLEDNALLVGAIASFAAVAATMYFTRSIDWYSPLGGTAAPGNGPSIARDSIWR